MDADKTADDQSTLLERITEAAAALVPLTDIPAAVGLSEGEWRVLLIDQRAEVRLAVLRGRTQTLRQSKERLYDAARRGSVEAAQFALYLDHGGPQPLARRQPPLQLTRPKARGRPRREGPRPA